MKKPYVKPQLYYENFELSQHVAACGWDMSNSKNEYECSAKGDVLWGNEAVNAFTGDNQLCEYFPEAYCYENGTETLFRVFNS